MNSGLTVRIGRAHPAFAGHFPGNPLVPGALLLDEAAVAIRERFGTDIRRVELAKFSAVLRPDVSCDVQLADGKSGVRLTCADQEQTYLTAIVSSEVPEHERGDRVWPSGTASVRPLPSAADIAVLLPHGGDMVLIERVEAWDDHQIVCSSAGHVAAHNPLRRADRLPAFAAVEYAAQTMALHSALMSNMSPQSGLLVSVRDLMLFSDRLDANRSNLRVHAIAVHRNRRGGVYTFRVSSGDAELVTGQVGAITTPASGRT